MKKYFPFLLSLLLFTAFAGCRFNNVKIDNDIEKFFKENNLTGTFALLDNGHSTFDIYNVSRYKDSSYAPGATFDIVNALTALEIGRLKDETGLIGYNNGASSVTLKDAFKQNNDSAFVALAASIGKDTMQYWLDSLHYGKTEIVGNGEPFWANDSLKITPDEQLGFIDKFYFSSFSFQKRVQKIVQHLMQEENNTMYSLAYKTSAHKNTAGKNIGWALGWIEENKHVYFFVLNATGPDSMTRDTLIATLKSILSYEGFFKGDK